MEVCRELDIPLYVHFHGYDASTLLAERRWVRRYRALFEGAHGIIAPSRFLAQKVYGIGCPRNRLHVNPYGVDPSRFGPTGRTPFRILAVGRLVDKKAPHATIEAFALVVRCFPDAQLDFIGDGPLMPECQALVAARGLGGKVRLHGAQPSEFVQRLMAEASIFVQHSVTAPNGDTEGLPVAILEAMAGAIPVVSTRHAGIPEAVIEGETGLLVDEHDVEGMAKSIAMLLADPVRGEKMGNAGRDRVLAQFTQAHACERLREIIGLSL
jgi:glycosyltransferase involved in cell wall biosynthesis